MRSESKVVVIGGGIAGCSVLYHLTKLGWNDVTLVEENELTSGSTWHAAGLCTHAFVGALHFVTQHAIIDSPYASVTDHEVAADHDVTHA